MPGKPRSGEMFIERQDQLRSNSSFRSATNRLSPINGLSAIGGLKLFYKHCIPTEFPPSDSLSEAANDMRVSEVFSYIPAEDADRWRVALASLCQGAIELSCSATSPESWTRQSPTSMMSAAAMKRVRCFPDRCESSPPLPVAT